CVVDVDTIETVTGLKGTGAGNDQLRPKTAATSLRTQAAILQSCSRDHAWLQGRECGPIPSIQGQFANRIRVDGGAEGRRGHFHDWSRIRYFDALRYASNLHSDIEDLLSTDRKTDAGPKRRRESWSRSRNLIISWQQIRRCVQPCCIRDEVS